MKKLCLLFIALALFVSALIPQRIVQAQEPVPDTELALELASTQPIPLGWAITVMRAQARLGQVGNSPAQTGTLSLVFSCDVDVTGLHTESGVVVATGSNFISETATPWNAGGWRYLMTTSFRPKCVGPFAITEKFEFEWNGVHEEVEPTNVTVTVIESTPTPSATPMPIVTPVTTVTPTVTPVDLLPTITAPFEGQEFQIQAEQIFTQQIQATDPEGQRLACWTGNTFPMNLSIDANRCMIRWTPSILEAGRRYEVNFVVSDRPLGTQGFFQRQTRRTFFITVLGSAPVPPSPVTPTVVPAPTPTSTPKPNLEPTVSRPPATATGGSGTTGGSLATPTTFGEEIASLAAQIQSEAQALNTPGIQTFGAIVGGYTYPYNSIPDSFTFQQDLGYGSAGQDVVNLQVFLNADSDTRVAASGDGSPGQETAYFGWLTYSAVCRFQEKYSVEVLWDHWDLEECTGYAGITTRAKANALLQEARTKRDAANQQRNSTVQVPVDTVKSLGADLRNLSGRLNNLVNQFAQNETVQEKALALGDSAKNGADCLDGFTIVPVPVPVPYRGVVILPVPIPKNLDSCLDVVKTTVAETIELLRSLQQH